MHQSHRNGWQGRCEWEGVFVRDIFVQRADIITRCGWNMEENEGVGQPLRPKESKDTYLARSLAVFLDLFGMVRAVQMMCSYSTQ